MKKIEAKLAAYDEYLKNAEGNEQECIQKMVKKDKDGLFLAGFFHVAVMSSKVYRRPLMKKVTDMAYAKLQKFSQKNGFSSAQEQFHKDTERYTTYLLAYRSESPSSCMKQEEFRPTRSTKKSKRKEVAFQDTVQTVEVSRYLPVSNYVKVDREFKALMLKRKNEREQQNK